MINIDEKRVMHTTELFKLLSDPTRLKILAVLMSAKRELCVNEIAEAVNVSQSATSHQLAKLEARGIVSCFRDGKTICYEIEDIPLVETIQAILKGTSNYKSLLINS